MTAFLEHFGLVSLQEVFNKFIQCIQKAFERAYDFIERIEASLGQATVRLVILDRIFGAFWTCTTSESV
jgi:hypothetical protein